MNPSIAGKAGSGPGSPLPRGAWVGYAAAGWAFLFMLAHIVWAAGWYVGLPRAMAQEMFSNPWKWAYDVAVAVACGIAVLVALALVQPWGRRVPRRLLNVLAWCGTGLLVLRSTGGLVQVGYWGLTGQWVPRLMDLYEVWFCLGAVLFGASLARFRRTDPASAAAGRL